MSKLILHIGASKCGSSALQTFLSALPSHISSENDVFEYGAIRPQGLLCGRSLTLSALGQVAAYTSSMAATDLWEKDTEWRDEIVRAINSRLKGGRSLILSNEGWFHRLHYLDRMNFFQKIDAKIEVVCYVRPQVPFINSAWWQWGAWSDISFNEWVEQRLPSTKWGDIAESWPQVDWIESFKIKPLSRDIVGNFLNLLRISSAGKSEHRSNTGLPAEILRVFQRYRSLRPNPRKAQIDFALSRYLGHLSSSPWVIDENTAEKIIFETLDSNKKLITLVDPADAEIITSDTSWWHTDIFRERQLESPEPQEIEYNKLENLCAEMAQVIFELEKKNRILLLKNKKNYIDSKRLDRSKKDT